MTAPTSGSPYRPAYCKLQWVNDKMGDCAAVQAHVVNRMRPAPAA
jgi:hypothetical protein